MTTDCQPTSNLQIAEQGTHKELTALKGIYYSLVRRQQKGLTPSDQDLSPMYPPLVGVVWYDCIALWQVYL